MATAKTNPRNDEPTAEEVALIACEESIRELHRRISELGTQLAEKEAEERELKAALSGYHV